MTYNTAGHCFFLEDGIEHGNEFIRNLAIQTKCHPTLECVPTNLAASGERDSQVCGSYSLRGSQLPQREHAAAFGQHGGVASGSPTRTATSLTMLAAGSDENGFWLSLPEHPQGKFKDSDVSKTIRPRRTPLRAFRGNVAHSQLRRVHVRPEHLRRQHLRSGHHPVPAVGKSCTDLDSEVVETHFESLTSYKNTNGGLWGRGDLFVYSDLKLADNADGMTHAAGDLWAAHGFIHGWLIRWSWARPGQ